jgi:hypothetical protein
MDCPGDGVARLSRLCSNRGGPSGVKRDSGVGRNMFRVPP